MKRSLACLFLALAGPLAAQSLWLAAGSRELSLTSDPKACRVGDIITIIIAESTSLSSTSNKTTNTSDAAQGAVTQFLFPPAVSGLGTQGGQLPGLGWGGKSDYSGGGKVNNSQVVTGRAAMLISRRKRSGPTETASSGRSTLIATWRPCLRSLAR